MHIRRLLATVASAALVGSTAAVVTTAAPAAAATPTTIVSLSSGSPWAAGSSYSRSPVEYGGNVYISVGVATTSGSRVYSGTLTVYRQLAGEAGFTPVASSTGSSPYVITTLPAEGNAVYRAYYSGTSQYDPTQADAGVQVQKDVTSQGISGRNTGVKGKVKPAGKTKIKVFRKQGKKWKKFKATKTNAKGAYRIVLPAPRRGKFHWKIVFVGGPRFVSTVLRGHTYKY